MASRLSETVEVDPERCQVSVPFGQGPFASREQHVAPHDSTDNRPPVSSESTDRPW
jgi:hypothetical protein